jgi:hypothetical protein
MWPSHRSYQGHPKARRRRCRNQLVDPNRGRFREWKSIIGFDFLEGNRMRRYQNGLVRSYPDFVKTRYAKSPAIGILKTIAIVCAAGLLLALLLAFALVSWQLKLQVPEVMDWI